MSKEVFSTPPTSDRVMYVNQAIVVLSRNYADTNRISTDDNETVE